MAEFDLRHAEWMRSKISKVVDEDGKTVRYELPRNIIMVTPA
jgi:hypothetical protein